MDEFWQLPYLGRTVTNKYNEMFNHNGCYPSEDYKKYPEYLDRAIILNLKLHLEDGLVEGISYQGGIKG